MCFLALLNEIADKIACRSHSCRVRHILHVWLLCNRTQYLTTVATTKTVAVGWNGFSIKCRFNRTSDRKLQGAVEGLSVLA